MGVLDRLRVSNTFLRITRVLQFLSSAISLGLFTSRVYFLLRKVQRLQTATGAVEGILAASVAYTLAAMLVQCCMKGSSGRGASLFRWLLVLLDLLFVGAFIAVAVLTNPNNGAAGPCTASNRVVAEENAIAGDKYCHLPLATFILAILSTLLHAITAIFKDRKERKHRKEEAYDEHHGGDGHY